MRRALPSPTNSTSALSAPVNITTASTLYADLVAAGVQIEPSAPMVGQAATAYVTINNIGGVAASNFAVQVSLSPGAGAAILVPWVTVAGPMAPGHRWSYRCPSI